MFEALEWISCQVRCMWFLGSREKWIKNIHTRHIASCKMYCARQGIWLLGMCDGLLQNTSNRLTLYECSNHMGYSMSNQLQISILSDKKKLIKYLKIKYLKIKCLKKIEKHVYFCNLNCNILRQKNKFTELQVMN